MYSFHEGTTGYSEILGDIRAQVDSCLKESELMWKTHNKIVSGSDYPFPGYLLPN
jgi:hypothetical protein